MYFTNAHPLWRVSPGGCGDSIAEKTPSPGGNLPSNRYLTRLSLLPAVLVTSIVAEIMQIARVI